MTDEDLIRTARAEGWRVEREPHSASIWFGGYDWSVRFHAADMRLEWWRDRSRIIGVAGAGDVLALLRRLAKGETK